MKTITKGDSMNDFKREFSIPELPCTLLPDAALFTSR